MSTNRGRSKTLCAEQKCSDDDENFLRAVKEYRGDKSSKTQKIQDDISNPSEKIFILILTLLL